MEAVFTRKNKKLKNIFQRIWSLLSTVHDKANRTKSRSESHKNNQTFQKYQEQLLEGSQKGISYFQLKNGFRKPNSGGIFAESNLLLTCDLEALMVLWQNILVIECSKKKSVLEIEYSRSGIFQKWNVLEVEYSRSGIFWKWNIQEKEYSRQQNKVYEKFILQFRKLYKQGFFPNLWKISLNNNIN